MRKHEIAVNNTDQIKAAERYAEENGIELYACTNGTGRFMRNGNTYSPITAENGVLFDGKLWAKTSHYKPVETIVTPIDTQSTKIPNEVTTMQEQPTEASTDYKRLYEELNSAHETNIADTNILIEANKEQINSLETDLESATTELSKAQDDIIRLENELITANEQISDLKDIMYEYNQSIASVFNGVYKFEEVFHVGANEDGSMKLILIMPENIVGE